MLNFSVADKSSSESNPSQKSENQLEYLELDEIRRDGGTQPRAAINLQHVKLLEEQMEDGHQLEPVIVFYDGESYWLADGYHRWHAHRNREEEGMACVIYQGSRRDAVLYSVGANADHKPALPRSQEDKRRAVMRVRVAMEQECTLSLKSLQALHSLILGKMSAIVTFGQDRGVVAKPVVLHQR